MADGEGWRIAGMVWEMAERIEYCIALPAGGRIGLLIEPPMFSCWRKLTKRPSGHRNAARRARGLPEGNGLSLWSRSSAGNGFWNDL